MKKVELLNLKGEKVKDINLKEEIFGVKPNKAVLHDAIILTMASLRQGTHKTKNRSEVSGGGRKPWRQKGTGRARQGSIRAVQWVGGGKYGTPVPRDYSKKQNRKERQLALKSALSEKVTSKELVVLENLVVKTPKTKEMKEVLNALKLADKKVLLVVKEFDDNLLLASRNLQNVVLILADELNVLDIVSTDVMVVTEDAVKYIEEVLV
ncbi:MAG: 50S ribosomal protein L4 [Clostridia bacterium]|nr:50S ribosomal protein L4 [Bacillus sp. (in: firmicutes)]MBR4260831.1 50S ribosomal protein L4 [Clostridia bacterium]